MSKKTTHSHKQGTHFRSQNTTAGSLALALCLLTLSVVASRWSKGSRPTVQDEKRPNETLTQRLGGGYGGSLRTVARRRSIAKPKGCDNGWKNCRQELLLRLSP